MRRAVCQRELGSLYKNTWRDFGPASCRCSNYLMCQRYRSWGLGSFHSIHNVVDRGVLQAMWEKLAGAKLDVACLLTTPIWKRSIVSIPMRVGRAAADSLRRTCGRSSRTGVDRWASCSSRWLCCWPHLPPSRTLCPPTPELLSRTGCRSPDLPRSKTTVLWHWKWASEHGLTYVTFLVNRFRGYGVLTPSKFIGGGAGGQRGQLPPPLADKGPNDIKCPHFADLVEWCLQERKKIRHL